MTTYNAAGLWDTEFGKELSKVCPEFCQRIIIDIPYDDVIRVYYQCCADKALLELNWENALQGADVISAKNIVKG